ncbi:hypothetical protein A8924_5368 [Saccharopolyspora erythraea NRRL 2338]|nr:hypothetical protein A8924_5368 [Saccharopolyspora erythraea NRRL 2338]
MTDTAARSRLVTTHVADHTEPCLRCGKPTAQRALAVTGTGHTCVARSLCGECTGPHHRAADSESDNPSAGNLGRSR